MKIAIKNACLQGAPPIKQQIFQTVFNEYRFREHSKRFTMQHINEFECPACWPHPHSLHVDGNMKLSTWDRNREMFRHYYNGAFFLADQDVLQHLDCMDLATGARRAPTVRIYFADGAMLVQNTAQPLGC